MYKRNYLIAVSSHPNLSFIRTASTSIDPFANTNNNSIISAIFLTLVFLISVQYQ